MCDAGFKVNPGTWAWSRIVELMVMVTCDMRLLSINLGELAVLNLPWRRILDKMSVCNTTVVAFFINHGAGIGS